MRVLFRSAVCAAIVGAVVYFYRVLQVNPTSVALTFLLCVLIVSATWGLLYALLLAIAATALFNYYFLPPTGTFTIADTQNWIALFVFLVTAVIASQLSDRARKQKDEAVSRRAELERLYNFSQQLLAADNILLLLNSIPEYVVDSFGVSSAAVYIPEKSNIYRAGASAPGLDTEHLQSIAARGEPVIDRERNLSLTPLRMGVKTVGAVGVMGSVSSQTMNAVGSLIAIAVERANAVESLSRSEAARESEKLRSAILDSITHEFRTPLTSIKASITSLLSTMDLSGDDRRDLMSVINEESDRLNRLVGEAAEMARLESHEFQLDLQPRRDSGSGRGRSGRLEAGIGQTSHRCAGRGNHHGAYGWRKNSGSAGAIAGKCRQVFAAGSADPDHRRIQRRKSGGERFRPGHRYRRYGAGAYFR